MSNNTTNELDKYLINNIVQTSILEYTYVDDYSQIITYKQCMEYLHFSKSDTILDNLKKVGQIEYQNIIFEVGAKLLLGTMDLGIKILNFTGFSLKKIHCNNEKLQIQLNALPSFQKMVNENPNFNYKPEDIKKIHLESGLLKNNCENKSLGNVEEEDKVYSFDQMGRTHNSNASIMPKKHVFKIPNIGQIKCYADFLNIPESKLTYRMALRFIYAVYDVNVTIFPATLLYFKLSLKSANVAQKLEGGK